MAANQKCNLPASRNLPLGIKKTLENCKFIFDKLSGPAMSTEITSLVRLQTYTYIHIYMYQHSHTHF